MHAILHLADAFWHEVKRSDDSMKVVDALVAYIADNGLTSQIPSIVRAIERRAAVIEHRESATVRTAYALSNGMKKEVARDLEDFAVHFEIHNELIGGIEVQTFDRRISGTVQSMLRALRQSFRQ